MTGKTDDDYQELADLFRTDPMLAREFLDIHDELMRSPWFRIRFFVALWRQRIRRWWDRG